MQLCPPQHPLYKSLLVIVERIDPIYILRNRTTSPMELHETITWKQHIFANCSHICKHGAHTRWTHNKACISFLSPYTGCDFFGTAFYQNASPLYGTYSPPPKAVTIVEIDNTPQHLCTHFSVAQFNYVLYFLFCVSSICGFFVSCLSHINISSDFSIRHVCSKHLF